MGVIVFSVLRLRAAAIAAFTLLSGLPGLAHADGTPVDWAKRLKDDVQAFHTHVVNSHPGFHDPKNPAFRAQVEASFDQAMARARTAHNQGGWWWTLKGFAASFNDGHVEIDAVEKDFALPARWPGFLTRFEGDDQIVVPDALATGPTVLVTEWLESASSLASVIAQGTQEERDHFGLLFTRFLVAAPARTGLLHADPHPGNFRVVPGVDGGPARLGVLDFGAVARLDGGFPPAMGRLLSVAATRSGEDLVDALREEGFIKDRIRVEPDLVRDYLLPFVEPAASDHCHQQAFVTRHPRRAARREQDLAPRGARQVDDQRARQHQQPPELRAAGIERAGGFARNARGSKTR